MLWVCGNKKMERIWHMEDDKTYWHCYKCGRKYNAEWGLDA